MYILKVITNRDIEENLYSDVNFVRTVYKLLFTIRLYLIFSILPCKLPVAILNYFKCIIILEFLSSTLIWRF